MARFRPERTSKRTTSRGEHSSIEYAFLPSRIASDACRILESVSLPGLVVFLWKSSVIGSRFSVVRYIFFSFRSFSQIVAMKTIVY